MPVQGPSLVASLVKGVVLLPLRELKPHESVDPLNLESVLHRLRRDQVLRRAVAIDSETRVVLDGHHRLKALELLGCQLVPCTLFDYRSGLIEVWSYPGAPRVSKEDVLYAALSGRLLPPKTSRHMVRAGSRYVHISEFEVEVNLPISSLR
ncbi:hypothetical protein IG193_07685 [Infirmifilum lucidum]|uniref:Transcriptional regulator n=1 Tax=Infirmifilum lucidum TaxID=2776706 RepID=A0A7L9FFR1_9CREN|nr:hypothetical protein [Infirmifilum lucidum]QOJ78630.1 hypothetical protein IG193_07685 [Infirmifilum lucidum]